MKNKPIHLILLEYGCECRAVCKTAMLVEPIETIVSKYPVYKPPKGTFNPKKVTCKRCLKHHDYKIAIEKIKYPLLYWRERV